MDSATDDPVTSPETTPENPTFSITAFDHI